MTDTLSSRRRGSSQARPEERLPFTVRIADDEPALRKAVDIRRAAYGRHLPELAKKMDRVEPADIAQGAVVLLAESKLDGTCLGTIRIQTNRFQPLALEQSVILPDWLQGRRLAEATRLGVADGQIGKVVKSLLFKAYFQYCFENDIDWMVITARSPLDRQYTAMLFQDVFPGRGFIPMIHVGNLPHRVLAFEVETVEPRWKAVNHPLFQLIFELDHPDLVLSTQKRQLANASDHVENIRGGWHGS
ncbi:N-acyl amino acid synthase FeeM domain-containing protein [Collimonas antrihumi]|uniref:N-acyl amino acid synthase FeeM domain-containing protein n=1 Tax=Collimonas antrihumi TaxID=1940615 RepID=UPI001B8C310A|nr:hypothetical protein [Collimonas antrihumi]